MCLMAKLLERQHPELERCVLESYSRLYITRSIFRSMERTNFRCEKGTYLKAKFRLWFESGWRHALVGAELGQVLLTVYHKRRKKTEENAKVVTVGWGTYLNAPLTI